MFNEQLKEATKKEHQQLEKFVVLEMKAIRTEEDYARMLSKFYRYFSALEQQFSPYITKEILPDFEERRKSESLEADLKELNYSITDQEEVSTPVLDTAIKALGALYVMEGSTMGGSIIVKMLQEKSKIDRGLSFFSGYGAETPAMWKKFTARMNEIVSGPEAEAELIAAAKDTFSHFGLLFAAQEQAA